MIDTPNCRVKILTYNLFMRPPGIKNHLDDYKNYRLEAILNHLNNYDILCFQELFETGNFRKYRLIEFCINNGFYFWAISDPPGLLSGVPVDGGLAVISRFPILHSRFYTYNLGILADCASDKGSLYCKILVNGSVLNIFNTHLQATYHNQIDNKLKVLTIMTRLYQFDILAQRIQKIVDGQSENEHELVLITGDLNTDARKTYFDLDFSEHKAFFDKFSLTIKYFNEYSVMIQILKNHGKNLVRDLAHERFKGHPITFGDGYKVFTKPEDVFSAQRLDYILEIQRAGAVHKLRSNVDSCQVEKFHVNAALFSHLSDHYGLSIYIHPPH